MANTIESVKQLIRKAVENASGWPTVFGPSQGIEPANQYCLVTLTSQNKQQHDVIKLVEKNNNLTEIQRDESMLEFEIQTRGDGAIETIDKITSYFDSSLRDLDLWPYIGSGGHDDAQSLTTEYQRGKILEVGIAHIYVHTTLPKENILEYFNVVDIEVKKSNNEFITNITIPEEN